MPTESLQLRSIVTADAKLQLSLTPISLPDPQPHEVVVKIEATPINPSDVALLLGAANPRTFKTTGTPQRPVLTADILPKAMGAMEARVGQSLPVGNEGAGIVIAAGTSPAAQALMGRTVALVGGGMFSTHRCVPAARVLPLPEGTPAKAAASWFVNPMTALAMVETMRREGHSALVHTAAASNLGQMLHKVCHADGVPLVNIVRRTEQADKLRALGAKYVCNSTDATFMSDLTKALVATGATLAFDAVGGGKLAAEILTCMEAAAPKDGAPYTPYGSPTPKQVYVYGGLNLDPIVLSRGFGMYWGVGGWLLTPRLKAFGPEVVQSMQARIAAEITTTFASGYTRVVSLPEAIGVEAITAYSKQATGEKVLINPST